MGFCIRALHLMPNISMKMIKITFLFFVGWPDFVVFAFNRLRPSGSALDLLRFYFLIKNINNFFQFRKNVLFLQKKPLLFQDKPLLISLNSLLENQFRVGPISWLTLDVFLE